MIANLRSAPQSVIDLIDEWEDAIRNAWPKKLQYLDAANIWSSAQLSLIFRPKGVTNQHRDTQWFLVTLATDRVQQFDKQISMHQAILPQRGQLETFWQYRDMWIMLPITKYAFDYKFDRRTRRLVNHAV